MDRKVHIWNFRANTIRSNRFARLGILTLVSCGIVVMLRTNFKDREVGVSYMPSVSEDSLGDISNEVQSSSSSSQARPVSKLKGPKTSNRDENDQSFDIPVQPFIHQTVNILDKYMDMDSTNYQAIRSMFLLWNPESSKWAAQVSGKYHHMVDKRTTPPKDWFAEPERDKVIKRKVEVEQCKCERTIDAHTMITYEGEDFGGNNSVSVCSKHSFARGAKQKVIAFSFYGDPNSKLSKSRKYFEGILENLKLVPDLYPGWTIRVYYDLAEDHPLMKDLCEAACNDPNLDLCHVRKIPSLGDISKVFPMNWRFVPLLDPQVSHMVSRDLDSLINSREAAAVQEWLKSDKAFHFMRDHPAHTIEILGSGWGARPGQLERTVIDEAFSIAVKDLLFWAPRHAYGPDQGFLKRYIWPWAKWSALSHDAYSCLQFPRTSPFPTKRENGTNNFVAAVSTSNDILLAKCPAKCRPKDHPDWEMC